MSEYQCPRCRTGYAAYKPWPCPSCNYGSESIKQTTKMKKKFTITKGYGNWFLRVKPTNRKSRIMAMFTKKSDAFYVSAVLNLHHEQKT